MKTSFKVTYTWRKMRIFSSTDIVLSHVRYGHWKTVRVELQNRPKHQLPLLTLLCMIGTAVQLTNITRTQNESWRSEQNARTNAYFSGADQWFPLHRLWIYTRPQNICYCTAKKQYNWGKKVMNCTTLYDICERIFCNIGLWRNNTFFFLIWPISPSTTPLRTGMAATKMTEMHNRATFCYKQQQQKTVSFQVTVVFFNSNTTDYVHWWEAREGLGNLCQTNVCTLTPVGISSCSLDGSQHFLLATMWARELCLLTTGQGQANTEKHNRCVHLFRSMKAEGSGSMFKKKKSKINDLFWNQPQEKPVSFKGQW